MKDNYKNKILVLTILTIIFAIMGSTLAFWNWNTSEAQRTLIGFTVDPNLSCTGDGGGNITSSEKKLVPTTCTNQTYAIQRTITLNTSSTISTNDLFLDLWLDVINIGEGLTNSENFKYAITKNPNDCTTNAVTGSFNGVTNGGRVNLLTNKEYIGTDQDTYYLYIWLDSAETSTTTMNQSFELQLGGSCQDDLSTQPESPVLDEAGMIPVTIDNSGNVKTISSTDENWYNYEEKKWANAILVTESSRANYLNTNNVPVTQSDILAYYVWIPRYKYKIPGKRCSELDNPSLESNPECYAPYTMSDEDKTTTTMILYNLTLSEGISDYTEEQAANDVESCLKNGYLNLFGEKITILDALYGINYDMGINLVATPSSFNGNNTIHGPNTIDIVFENGNESVTNGNTVTEYITHPAFIWDGVTKSGIWVGKFETTGTASQPTILNNKSSLRNQTVSVQFTTSLLFAGGSMDASSGAVTFAGSSTYGLTTETNSHMMKNSEWGAVAYLSHSQYGINGEIRINNQSGFTTGCGAETADVSYTSTCTLAYGSGINEYPQSTTGNITGVFDMSGGAWEYVMGNYNNTTKSSGFTTFPESKYYDVYTTLSACTPETCGGHALNETSEWYGDLDVFVDSSLPWFRRGGVCSDGAEAGAFYFVGYDGDSNSAHSWRSVLSAR